MKVKRSEYAHRLPIHKGGEGPDGRSGWQVLNSAIHYLQWSRGDSWRPASHRFHPEVTYFTGGIQVLLSVRFMMSRGATADDIAAMLAAHFTASEGRRRDGNSAALKTGAQSEGELPSAKKLPTAVPTELVFLSAPPTCYCAEIAERRQA